MRPTLFEHKTELKYSLKTFGMTLFLLLGFSTVFLLSKLYFTEVSIDSLLIVASFSTFPSILLLIEYFIFSLNFSFNIEGNNVMIFKNSLILNYKYSDITYVTKYCSYPYSRGRKRIYLATDSFYFLKVQMADKKQFIITSLMTDLKNSQFKIDKIEERFMASIIFS